MFEYKYDVDVEFKHGCHKPKLLTELKMSLTVDSIIDSGARDKNEIIVRFVSQPSAGQITTMGSIISSHDGRIYEECYCEGKKTYQSHYLHDGDYLVSYDCSVACRITIAGQNIDCSAGGFVKITLAEGSHVISVNQDGVRIYLKKL